MPASRVNLRGGPVANRTLPETDADARARSHVRRHRLLRHPVLPVSDGVFDRVALLARVRRRLHAARSFYERWRPRHLARAAVGAHWLLPADPSWDFRADQARRVSEGHDS